MKNKIKFGDVKRFEEIFDSLNILMNDIYKYNRKAHLFTKNGIIYLAKNENNIVADICVIGLDNSNFIIDENK